MEAGRDFLDSASKGHFERKHRAAAWWKALTEEERRAAYKAWLADNPGDFRSGWGFELASISRNSMQAFWEHNNINNKQ